MLLSGVITFTFTIATANLVLFSIHTHTVKGDCLQNLSSHDVDAAVAWKFEIEETSVSPRQNHILSNVALVRSLFDHKSNVLSREWLVVGGDTFLAPAELDELLLFFLSELTEHLPEHLDDRVVNIVLARVAGVTHQQLNINRILTAH